MKESRSRATGLLKRAQDFAPEPGYMKTCA